MTRRIRIGKISLNRLRSHRRTPPPRPIYPEPPSESADASAMQWLRPDLANAKKLAHKYGMTTTVIGAKVVRRLPSSSRERERWRARRTRIGRLRTTHTQGRPNHRRTQVYVFGGWNGKQATNELVELRFA